MFGAVKLHVGEHVQRAQEAILCVGKRVVEDRSEVWDIRVLGVLTRLIGILAKLLLMNLMTELLTRACISKVVLPAW